MSACTEHFRTVQDIEQARDYSRHASRGVDSGRLFVHAPCTLQSALGGAHHAPAIYQRFRIGERRVDRNRVILLEVAEGVFLLLTTLSVILP